MTSIRLGLPTFLMSLVLGSGCVPQGEDPTAPEAMSIASTAPAADLAPVNEPLAAATQAGGRPLAANDDWMTEVSARIRDASHAFIARDGGFIAEVPERGLKARFDQDGASLTADGATVALRTVGVGRDATAEPGFASPEYGACIDGMKEPSGECVRRLEYTSDGMTEWWAGRDDGFEQGWTFDAPPDGYGELSIEVAVADATVSGSRDELRIQGAGGLLTVSGLQATDADGMMLDAWFEATDDGFRVRVDDANARYPVVVDPVYTTPAWSAYGLVGNQFFARTVAGAGDINGDGYLDVVVGSDKYNADEGAAFVYLGGATGLPATASATLHGSAEGDHFSWAISAGDVNGDGYSDVLCGAYNYGHGRGQVQIFLGSSAGTVSSPAATLIGENAGLTSDADGDQFGYSIAQATDTNNDGYDDVIVGAYGYSSDKGRAYVYLGGAGAFGTTASQILTGETTGDQFGYSVASAHDVNGDGKGDIIVGAPAYSTTRGRIYVYSGNATGLATSTVKTVTGDTGNFGKVVAGAGDLNNDGYDDLMVGEPNYSPGGRVFIYRGTSSGMSTVSPTILTGSLSGINYGGTLAGVGDINADGYADIAVGASTYSSSKGRVYLYKGSSTGVVTTTWATLTGEAGSDYFASTVAGVGDVNADGYDDLVVGAWGYDMDDPSWDFFYSIGRAYLYRGSASGIVTSALTVLNGWTNDGFGISVAGAGDINADGYADVMVGAPLYGFEAGRVFVFNGSALGLAATPSATLSGETAEDEFGATMAPAGDIDGDGYDDVVIGAPYYDVGGDNEGRVYVYRGSAAGLGASPATIVTGGSGVILGGSIDGAGDVNGDGYDDIIAGNIGGYGTVNIYKGGAAGLSTTAATFLTGDSSYTYFGRSVSGAGDVNGDGFDDVIVGASAWGTDRGRAYLFEGSASGVSTTASAILTGESDYDYFASAVDGGTDVNHDGYDDVIVGSEGYSSYRGRVYLFPGGPTGLSTSPLTVLTGEGSGDDFGSRLSAAGDLNGDGFSDIVVGASGYGSTDTGRVYVFGGAATGLLTTAVSTVDADNVDSDHIGGRVSGAGDVNGDGYGDVIVGDYDYARYDGRALLLLGNNDDVDHDGYTIPSDCNDANASIHPGAPELCDASNTDEDCDGLAEDADPDSTGKTNWYADGDSDTYPGGTASLRCDAGGGFASATSTDCNDANVAVHPGATEVCDASNLDENCNGLAEDADPSSTGKTSWYADADLDTYGTGTPSARCDAGGGYTATTSTDCNDANASIHPGGTEVCDPSNLDEDCDGVTEDADPSATGKTSWYVDSDADTYGTGTAALRCDAGGGYTSTSSTDCNDGNAAISPAATEICDSTNIDQDCDGLADDLDPSVSSAGKKTWYADVDLDTYGSMTSSMSRCDAGGGFTVTSHSDCDDSNKYVKPGGAELCDGVRNNCSVASWTDAAEDGTAAKQTGSTWTSVSLTTSGYTVGSGSTLWLCRGTFHTKLTLSGTAPEVIGLHGSAVTTIDGSGTGRVMSVSGTDAYLEGLTLTNGTSVYGAGIYQTGTGLTGYDLDITNNTATSYGGGIYDVSGDLDLVSSTFEHNTAPYGGGLYAKTANVSFDTVTFDDNQATTIGGGGLYASGGSVDAVSTIFTSNDATSTSTLTTYGGGAAYLTDGGTYSFTDGTVFDSNTAYWRGGALFITGPVATSTQTTVTLSTSDAMNNTVFEPTTGYGGGVYIAAGNFTMDGGSTVQGNHAIRGAGLTAYQTSTSYVVNLKVEDGSAVTSNTASNSTATSSNVYGGGLYLYGDAVEATLLDATLEANHATSSGTGTALGGGMFIGNGAMMSCETSSVVTNVATSTSGAARGGGGYLNTVAGTELDSTGCDWGAGATNNAPKDIHMGTTAYTGTSGTFTCLGSPAGCS